MPCAFPVWLRVGSLAFPSPVTSFLDSLEVGRGYLAAKNDEVASDDSLFTPDCLHVHSIASSSCRTLHLIKTFCLTGNHFFLFQNQDVRGWELDPAPSCNSTECVPGLGLDTQTPAYGGRGGGRRGAPVAP